MGNGATLDSSANNLYDKTGHSYIYVAYSRPNGQIDWAEFFEDSQGWPGCAKSQKNRNFSINFFPRATPGHLASNTIKISRENKIKEKVFTLSRNSKTRYMALSA